MSEVPEVRIGLSDLSTILSVLNPYSKFVHLHLRPLRKRNEILEAIKSLEEKIKRCKATALSLRQEEPIFLTEQDLKVIDQALSFFITQISRLVPASAEREDTLMRCEMLRLHFNHTVKV